MTAVTTGAGELRVQGALKRCIEALHVVDKYRLAKYADNTRDAGGTRQLSDCLAENFEPLCERERIDRLTR